MSFNAEKQIKLTIISNYNTKNYLAKTTPRPLQSNPFMTAISSAANSKSNTSKLETIRDFVTDLGMTTCPR